MADCFDGREHIIVTLEAGPGVRLTAGEIVDGERDSILVCRRCGRLMNPEPYEIELELQLEPMAI